MTYDSRPDTLAHIAVVRELLAEVAEDLRTRALAHDRSKLDEPEKAVFDVSTPKLRGTTYPSPEYDAALAEMGVGLDHHYAANDHHPQHFDDGIHGMNLVQIIEMLADWKAATLRHDDGDLRRSIESNAERFGYGPGLKRMLLATADYFGWLARDVHSE